jgi:hypothetical protein
LPPSQPSPGGKESAPNKLWTHPFPLALLRRSGYAKAKGEIRKGVENKLKDWYLNHAIVKLLIVKLNRFFFLITNKKGI